MNVTWDNYSILLDYDVSAHRTRPVLAKTIGLIASHTISSLGGYWRIGRQIK